VDIFGNFVAVHDIFSWLSVLILLVIETAGGYLYHLTKPMVSGLSNMQDTEKSKFLKVITDPLTGHIVAVSIQHSILFVSNLLKFGQYFLKIEKI